MLTSITAERHNKTRNVIRHKDYHWHYGKSVLSTHTQTYISTPCHMTEVLVPWPDTARSESALHIYARCTSGTMRFTRLYCEIVRNIVPLLTLNESMWNRHAQHDVLSDLNAIFNQMYRQWMLHHRESTHYDAQSSCAIEKDSSWELWSRQIAANRYCLERQHNLQTVSYCRHIMKYAWQSYSYFQQTAEAS